MHKFEKPNDQRALGLMDHAAKEVLREFGDARLAFGESDEYSFIFHKHAQLYGEHAGAWDASDSAMSRAQGGARPVSQVGGLPS